VNHHLALEYLAQHAPEIPAPRPHGLVKLADLNVMFMSYVPGCTLAKAWAGMSIKDKKTIQNQMNKTFLKVRSLPHFDRPLGTLDGCGVMDVRGYATEYESDKVIHTISEFEDFVFSPQPCISSTYIRFLRNLVHATADNQKCVFTHCDLMPNNIMVDANSTEDWVVTGIIDWDDAGFYPAYWESVKSMRTVLANAEMDWYHYQPECTAPPTYADKWLLDFVWNGWREKVALLVLRAKRLG
jgi:aminoglycoside phosphotransferase (APT) family kinase protein